MRMEMLLRVGIAPHNFLARGMWPLNCSLPQHQRIRMRTLYGYRPLINTRKRKLMMHDSNGVNLE
jgi:hypothetical protein